MMDKLAKAAQATAEINRIRRAAIAGLNGDGFAVNAEGVLMSGGDAKAALRAARDALAQALEIVDGTPWPTAADYAGPRHDND